jgi:Mor family transcriptional regulator
MYLVSDSITEATNFLLFLVYYDHDFSPHITTKERNEQIKKRYQAGETITALARVFCISPQRVDQIIKSKKRVEERGNDHE